MALETPLILVVTHDPTIDYRNRLRHEHLHVVALGPEALHEVQTMPYTRYIGLLLDVDTDNPMVQRAASVLVATLADRKEELNDALAVHLLAPEPLKHDLADTLSSALYLMAAATDPADWCGNQEAVWLHVPEQWY
jgi:hypothetical protein